MNASQLIQHYERLADSPNAVIRLREFIVDLAVRGKLVQQEAEPESAAALLARISKEKMRLIENGDSRRQATASGDSTAEQFPLPPGWAWTRLGNVIDLVSGQHLQPAEYSESAAASKLPYITGPSDFGRTGLQASRYALVRKAVAKRGQLLLTVKGSGVGKALLCDIPEVAISRQLMALTAILWETRYMVLVTHLLAESLRKKARSLIPGISRDDVMDFVFGLPPLPEQHRIVAQVDELMALCDQLEKARADREKKRDKLTVAALARLNSPTRATFRNDARFALENLQALTTRPDQIKQLRQTILNLAIRGLLVRQDPADEPASELLKRISQSVRSTEKRRHTFDTSNDGPSPFDLPVGWAWATFPSLGVFGRGKSKHRPRNDPALFVDGTHPLIQTGDVARSRGLIRSHSKAYNDVGLAQSAKWPAGTMCITIAANIADSGILTFDACFPDSVVGFRPAAPIEDARYFEYFMRTAKANLLEFAPATAQKNINLEILSQVLIPVPPLAEQRRIVTRVEELMSVCDEFEEALAVSDVTRGRLLDGLLAVALKAPTEREEAPRREFDASGIALRKRA